jgi:hypothetical protein
VEGYVNTLAVESVDVGSIAVSLESLVSVLGHAVGFDDPDLDAPVLLKDLVHERLDHLDFNISTARVIVASANVRLQDQRRAQLTQSSYEIDGLFQRLSKTVTALQKSNGIHPFIHIYPLKTME